MKAIRYLKVPTEKYLRKSIRAYFEGEPGCDLRWIGGILRSSVNFEQLGANIRDLAVDVILLDTTFWGGIRPCLKAAGICETFQLGVSVHSSGELGIQLASMLHMASVIPNLSFAADAHYHELVDDIIEGGKLKYEDGSISVPSAPGLGVRLDREKLAEYSEMYRRLGPYPYDRDPLRPCWTATIPNDRWANPADDRRPEIPY